MQNIFSNSSLISKTGLISSASHPFQGKEVALYFAAAWCPMCANFTPHLKEFYNNNARNVEIVLISSDLSKESAEAHFLRDNGDWLSVAYGDDILDVLKARFKIWSGREASKFGHHRRSGIPSLVLITESGDELAYLNTERDGKEIFKQWENLPQENKWTC